MSALRIFAFDILPSTQDEARRRVLSGEAQPGSVIRAAVQTAGRGQRARDWQAGPGGSYQTVIVPEPATLHPGAALLIALGLAEVLPTYGVRAGLKWPNDLYYRGKKLAGVLLERVAGYLLIGVGMNVNNEVPPGAVGLRGWDVEGAHMVVLEGIGRGLAHHADRTFALSGAFHPFDLLYGQDLEVLAAGTTLQGRGGGVDAEGRLRLLLPGGEVRAIASGHVVSFKLGEPTGTGPE